MEINTYSEMNEKITDYLRLNDDPICLYAAARIEELEETLQQYKAREKELDAAVSDMKSIADSIDDCNLVAEDGSYVRDYELGRCRVCKRGNDCDLSIECDFEWRGIKED